MYYLLVYDIETSEDKKNKLNKVAKECENYGVRVQNSVFEGELLESQAIKLKVELDRYIREDKDIKQKDMAAFLHMQPNTYNAYEKGKRTITADLLRNICIFLAFPCFIFMQFIP